MFYAMGRVGLEWVVVAQSRCFQELESDYPELDIIGGY